MKVTVVVNEAGQVIAAHVPVSSEGPSDSYAEEEGLYDWICPVRGSEGPRRGRP